MIALKVILCILVLLIIVLAALLSIPVKYCMQGHKFESYFVNAEIHLFFSSLQFILSKEENTKAVFCFKILGHSVIIQNKPEKKIRKKRDKKQQEKKKSSKGRKPLTKDFFKCILKFIKSILGHMKPQKIYLEGCYGFDDPSITGKVCAFTGSLCRQGQNYNIKLSPVFHEEILEGRFNIQGRIVPIALLYMSVKLILSPPVLNIIKERKSK